MPESKSKLNLYTFIKFLAAILVIRDHVGFDFPSIFLPSFITKIFPFLNFNLGFLLTGTSESGTWAVALFFVLSGFLIFKNFLSGKYSFHFKSIAKFYFGRIIRIAPLYYFLSLFGLFFVFSSLLNPQNNQLNKVLEIMTFNYDPNLWFNYAYWTVGVEMIFYVLAPFVFGFCLFLLSFFDIVARIFWSAFRSIFLNFLKKINYNPKLPNNTLVKKSKESSNFSKQNGRNWGFFFLGIIFWVLGLNYIWTIRFYFGGVIDGQFFKNLHSLRDFTIWFGVFVSGMGLAMVIHFISSLVLKSKEQRTENSQQNNLLTVSLSQNSLAEKKKNCEAKCLKIWQQQLKVWLIVCESLAKISFLLTLLVLLWPFTTLKITLEVSVVYTVLATSFFIFWVELAEIISKKIQTLKNLENSKNLLKNLENNQIENHQIEAKIVSKLKNAKNFLIHQINQISKTSYGIFLVHVLILVKFNDIYEKTLRDSFGKINAGIIIWLSVAFLSVLTSMFLQKSIENPSHIWLTNWQKRLNKNSQPKKNNCLKPLNQKALEN